ncbi:hypothetical protein [Cecembia calidifontis]|uniref:Uncharacterized protein n=1 Tax=Cecembia calidifontis TaxID=1187080 RepID=A0A4Q7P661_9BACT|nr:hypothetical protein [Cecembia calidifontis]RZS94950.1 hypothetical protein BC751_0462 [Cecembia calidifontis]
MPALINIHQQEWLFIKNKSEDFKKLKLYPRLIGIFFSWLNKKEAKFYIDGVLWA